MNVTRFVAHKQIQILLYSCIILFLMAGLVESRGTKKSDTIDIRMPDGSFLTVQAMGDEDGDGIANELEQNGYYWDADSFKVVAWDGDESKTYFVTDPLQASTDQDPYSDFTEVSGVNLDVGVFPPEDHPLVAARPRITVNMVEYDVIPLVTITDARGGAQGSAFTNEVSNSTTVGVEVTQSVEYGSSGVNGSTSVSASYSETVSRTESSTRSSEINWNNARSTQPDKAARLELIAFVENTGSTEALDVIPTVNLKLGDKIIATFNLPEAESLSPKGTTGSKTSNFNVAQADGGDITVTLDELKAIQRGTPLTLEVIQVQANVETLDTNNTEIVKSWNQYTGDIDLVSVDVVAIVGDEVKRHQVFAGWTRWDPEFSFEEIISLVLEVEEAGGQTKIEGRNYTDEWYLSSPSQRVLDEWEGAGRPSNILSLRMFSNTKIVMLSPGQDASPQVNLASYSTLPTDTSAYSRVLVSAVPNNFPISEVKAEIPINGEIQTVTLQRNKLGFYTNDLPLENTPAGPGKVFVKNARGDVTEATITLPAIYKNAAEVKEFSSFIPSPGADYWIYHEGDENKPMLLYCMFFDRNNNELATPREYLTLKKGEAFNFIKTDWSGADRAVHFEKIRLDAETLTVDRQDATFIEGAANVQNLTYARAFRCSALPDPAVNIDLTGTPFFLDPFTKFFSFGTTVALDSSRQVADITLTQLGGTCQFAGIDGPLQLVYDDTEKLRIQDGLARQSLRFNTLETGEQGYINMGSPATLEVNNAMTLEAWIKPASPVGSSGEVEVLLNKEGEYELFRWSDGTIRWALATGNPHWKTINTYYHADENEWVHVAVTYDMNAAEPTIKTYINGNLFHGTTGSGAITDFSSHLNQDSFRIAAREASSSSYKGLVDEVRIWNVARLQSEIESTIADTLGPEFYTTADRGLIGYWRFDQIEDLGVAGDGVDDIRDFSVNANHGDLVGDVVPSDITTDIKAHTEHPLPDNFALHQNYPNPFNPTTQISYLLPEAADVELSIFNVQGQQIRVLVKERQVAGNRQLQWDGRSDNGLRVASGVYVYRLRVGSFVKSRKMLLLK